MKNILIRADSSSKIGLGHIMRDLVLAKQYKDDNIFFASQNLQGNANAKILNAGHHLKVLKSNDIKELIVVILELKIDLLIIDHYKIDYKDEREIKNKTAVKILSFDDMYKRHEVDIVLNHNICAQKSRYKNLLPKSCELRCGKKYTLLRDEFYKEKKKSKKDVAIKRGVLLAMGGTDHSNVNIKILKALEKFPTLPINIITSSSNKNLDNLRNYLNKHKNITLHIDSNKIAKLMRKSSFAILSPSVTANEAYFMKLPIIAIKTASNQDDMYRFLKKNNYATLKKFDKKLLQLSVEEMLCKI